MTTIELVIISIGLSMDAFAVSICRGLMMQRMSYCKALIIALFFGMFQAIMPCIGFYIGMTFTQKITAIDHWVAFILLGAIGINMIKESFISTDTELTEGLYIGELLLLSIATSIDALAIGVTFAFLDVDIINAASIIGILTLLICFFGVKVGNIFGHKFKGKAEVLGGFLLILMALKILLDHVFF